VQNVGIFPSRILLAIGGCDDADLVTRKAVDLAEGIGCELYVVYVGQLPSFLMKNLDTIGFDLALYEEIEREALEMLWNLTCQVKVSGGTVAGAHLRMGSVAEEIVTLAKDLEADLIVIGSRGHGGLRRMIEGSISEHVVRHAHCPVMIVRADQEEHRGFWRKIFSSGYAGFR
jgi:nucleotide-binding universal stress UspA family protein